MAELGEKTEEPTGRRLADARQKGQVPKSQDLTGALSLVVAAVTLLLFGGFIMGRLHDLVTRGLSTDATGPLVSQTAVFELVRVAAYDSVYAIAPVMLIMFLGITLATIIQTGLLLTTKPLTPDLTRLSPIKGAKRILGPRGVIKTVMNCLKLSVVVAVAALVIMRNEPKLIRLAVLDPTQAAMVTGTVLAELLAWILFLLIVIGIVDFLYQQFQHKKDLRMTKQEVKDEMKNMEGDPEMKRRRFKIAQDIALQRVQQDVPDADVIVTNPTHFSVALRYAAKDAAPRVVAKGGDHLAFRIRQIAIANRVPIVERPPLARALYWGTEVGDLISPEHYEAVAEILAYVYELEGRAADERSARQAGQTDALDEAREAQLT